eukprot:TRINITY_DN27668_c0_g1_i5.p1 TRINITY_DN27668_c0_g1~~TRINITY_DN27668_c0_g1_i5.p1  ORF type:complete len:497 (+),score=95.56 TRINITY_DN27668_c0_g1_i5:172-1491(+)
MEEEEKPLLEKEEQDEENLIKAEIPSDDVEIKESEEPENVVPPIIPENEISLEDIEEEIKIEEETEKEEEPKIKPENNSSPSYEWNQPVEESPKEEEAPKETSDFSSEFDDDLLDESEFEEASEEKKVDFFDKPAQPKEEVNTPAVEETVLDKIQQQETKEETPKENLHSKFAGKQEKENEEEEKEENDVYSALLDKLDKGDVKPLKGNISLNLKFKFQNELFGGSNEEFNHAIELIDGCDNYHAAISLIKERYVNKYNWDFGEESTIEFLSMVKWAICQGRFLEGEVIVVAKSTVVGTIVVTSRTITEIVTAEDEDTVRTIRMNEQLRLHLNEQAVEGDQNRVYRWKTDLQKSQNKVQRKRQLKRQQIRYRMEGFHRQCQPLVLGLLIKPQRQQQQQDRDQLTRIWTQYVSRHFERGIGGIRQLFIQQKRAGPHFSGH